MPLRSVGRSNFDKGLHNLATLIKKQTKKHILIRTAILYTYINSKKYIRETLYTHIFFFRCNFDCYSSTFTILSTLFSLYSFVVTTIYIYMYITYPAYISLTIYIDDVYIW